MGRKRISDEKYALRGRKGKRVPAKIKQNNIVTAAEKLMELERLKSETPIGHPDRAKVMRAVRKFKKDFLDTTMVHLAIPPVKDPVKVPKPSKKVSKLPRKAGAIKAKVKDVEKKPRDSFDQWVYDFRFCYGGSEYDPEKCK